ncbi:MAG: TIGR02302 family protein [Pseudomonadota bacterium]
MNQLKNSKQSHGLVYILARIALVWEALWPLLVPLFIAVCAFLAFTWVGGWHYLNAYETSLYTWIARLGFAGVLLASVWPLRLFRFPGAAPVTRRIETASQLDNRPLTAVDDTIAFGRGDTFAKALWQEHRERMAKKSSGLIAGSPKPEANRFDPRALRAMVPLLAFAAYFYSYSPHGGKIADAYQKRSAENTQITRVDAWITPPSYTKKPPIFLSLAPTDKQIRAVLAPEQSEFVLRYLGADNIELTSEGGDTFTNIEPKSEESSKVDREFGHLLAEDQVLSLRNGEEVLSQWGISIVPDKAPKITFFEHPTGALSGSLQLSYTLQDDYGVVGAKAIVESLLEQDEDARPLIGPPEVKLSLPRNRARKGVSKINRDLTEHPWAGSRVSITLEARDDLGQTGRSETREITLPGRRFSKPLALALVEQRRILALDANKQDYVANLLDAVTSGGEEYIDDATAFMGMRIAYRRIVDARGDDDLRDALDLLWDIALAVEFGDLSEAERRLREAQENLSDALENGASEEEINRLMDELRQAMNEMMEALAEQARNNPQSENPFDPENAEILTQNDLQRMMDRIEELAKSGNQDAARQMLSELQRMMDNLRAGRHEQQRQAEGNELNEALDKLGRLMQRQQELLNETFRMRRNQEQGLRPHLEQDGQRQQGQQQGEQQQQQGNRDGSQQQPGNQNGRMSEQELADALRQLQQQQQELERQLGELTQQLESLGLNQPKELGEAQREMGEAGDNLGKGDTGAAATDQGQALEALGRGAQNMMRQMAGDRQQGGQQQSQNGGQGRANRGRTSDPLGRQVGEDNLNANSDTEIPGEIDVQRARRILEAIRKRLAIPDNPLIEKDYLERLLRSE